jgi:hypothetical protein
MFVETAGSRPGRTAVARLRAWLATAELPGAEADEFELLRQQLLVETAVAGSDAGLRDLRHLAARYGPPDIAALARPESRPRPPRHRQN